MPSKPKAFRAAGAKSPEQSRQDYDRLRRENAPWRRWYNTSRWHKLRTRVLAYSPLCKQCTLEGRTVFATVVDHRKPHRGSFVLFFDVTNLDPLCKTCHDTKTGSGQ